MTNIQDDSEVLARANAVQLTANEMAEFVEATEELPRDQRGFEAHAVTAAKLHPGDFNKVTALMFRVEALARLLTREGVPGWTLGETPDGAVVAETTLFTAAAVEPLIDIDGRLAFDPDSFRDRVLRLADLQVEG